MNIYGIAQWITTSFPRIRIVLLALMVVSAVVMILLVLFQPSNSEGMGALSGQTSDTFYSKNKGRSIEGVMKRLTVIFGIVLAVISILFFVTVAIYPVNLML